MVAAGLPVNYQETVWPKHRLRILFALALVVGIAVAACAPDAFIPGVILAAAAIALLILHEFYLARLRAARRWVIDTGRGFRWIGGPEIEVLDVDVIAVRIQRTSKFSAGVLQGVVRRFEAWTAASDRPLCMTNRIAAHESDPLSGLISRIVDDLKQRTAAGLADGATLEGGGWRLAGLQLTVGQGRKAVTLPFAEIDMAEVYGGKLCLWLRGQDESRAKIDPASKNAAVLSSLLADWIDHQRQAAGGRPAEDRGASGLGRVLFERRSRDPFTMYLGGAVHLAVMGGVWLFGHHLLLVLAIPLALGVFEVVFGHFRFRCFESGLGRRWKGSEFLLPFDEITEFTYVEKPILDMNTQLSMTFRAPRGTIRFVGTVQNADCDLETLRDRVARIVAARMLSQVQHGIAVPWTGDFVLLPEGLQYRRPAMFGLAPSQVEVLPYGQIRDVKIDKGVCNLYGKSAARPLISKPVRSVNFFPGYFALKALQKGGIQNMPNSSRASSVIISGDQGGESVTSTLTSPAPSSPVKV
jgi:hypothetical protein